MCVTVYHIDKDREKKYGGQHLWHRKETGLPLAGSLKEIKEKRRADVYIPIDYSGNGGMVDRLLGQHSVAGTISETSATQEQSTTALLHDSTTTADYSTSGRSTTQPTSDSTTSVYSTTIL